MLPTLAKAAWIKGSCHQATCSPGRAAEAREPELTLRSAGGHQVHPRNDCTTPSKWTFWAPPRAVWTRDWRRTQDSSKEVTLEE